jgi:hypothetical protein
MRIFFITLFVILGTNLGIELLNSNMLDVIEQRNEQLQRAIDRV